MEVTVKLEFKLHPGQQEVFTHPARYKILECGKRWGKSQLSGYACAYLACKNANIRVWYIGLTRETSWSVVWEIIQRLFQTNILSVLVELNRELNW